jgi:hypothetical protein
MLLRRRFVLAVVAVVATAVAYVVVGQSAPHPSASARNRASAGALRRLDGEILRRLKVPADFVPLTSGCAFYPCYRVARRIVQVAPQLQAILASTGAVRASPTGATNGCNIVHPIHLGIPIGTCSYVGTIDSKIVIVSLDPYVVPNCKHVPNCLSLFRTNSEVDVALPGASGAPPPVAPTTVTP